PSSPARSGSIRRCSRTVSARRSCTTSARRSTGTSSGSRPPSSREPAPPPSAPFFPKTRPGEVQSRIANDIGGIDTVVTSTATSVLSNVTTVIATVIAMVLLDWRLALFGLILLPVFVWLTRRVGDQRRKVAAERQVSL